MQWKGPAIGRLLVSLAVVAAVTGVAVRVGANAATVGFAYLITILGIAVWGGLTISLISSIAATACYNYFFLPPVGTFTIQDPANWIALATFFIASLVVSRLVVNAREEAELAAARQRDVEALYSLSIDLFTATSRVGALMEATTRVLSNVGAVGGGLVLFGGSPHIQQVVAWIGQKEDEIEDLIAGVGRHQEPLEFPSRGGRDVYLPLNVGGRVGGVLVVRRSSATVRALESVAALLALAVERERFMATNAHLQALRESEALKTSILRAVSHDLTTPLTAIALQVERLREQVATTDPALRTVVLISEQSDRLRRRIENLLTMARLESGKSVPRPEPTPPSDLFHTAREHLALIGEKRRFDVEIDDDCPDVMVDPSLAVEILVNLIENADRVAPPGTPLGLIAHRHPVDGSKVRLEILDEGPGIQRATELADQFISEAEESGDSGRRGLGLEIARSLAAANHGEVTLANRPDGGAAARLDLPAAEAPIADREAV